MTNNQSTDNAHNERLLLDFVETAGVGLHWVGRDGTILWANRADYEPLGYEADDYIGHNITEFHVNVDTISDILRRLVSGERLRDYEAALRCKDGSTRSVIINSSVLFDEQGNFVHTRCFTHDVTERKRIDQAKEQFVNILGHDLRNPLSAITVAAQFMLNSGDLAPQHERAAARIARAAARMSRMVADLLDFARGRMGDGIPIRDAPMDMAVVCKEAIDELQSAHSARHIGFVAQGDTSGTWDAGRVAQVVSNLVANALQHGSDPISVRLTGTGDAVTLVVENSGPPIPPHILSTLFEPFPHRDTSSTDRIGLGLGLFIAREIVRAH